MAGLTVPEILAIKLQRGQITQSQHDRALAKHAPQAAPSTRPAPTTSVHIPSNLLPTMAVPSEPEKPKELSPLEQLNAYITTKR